MADSTQCLMFPEKQNCHRRCDIILEHNHIIESYVCYTSEEVVMEAFKNEIPIYIVMRYRGTEDFEAEKVLIIEVDANGRHHFITRYRDYYYYEGVFFVG